MIEKRRRPAAAGIIPLIVVLALSSVVWTGVFLSSQEHNGEQGSTASSYVYRDNGLTCSVPVNSVPTAVAALVSEVTHNPKFLKVANSSPYAFGNAEEITGRFLTTGGTLPSGATQNGSVNGGTTIPLPNVMEMVFYSYGPGTTCGDTGVRLDSITSVNAMVIQVPIESGGFNMTGATFSLTAANWG